MDALIKVIGAAILGILLIGFAAFLGGTLVYWFWPHVIPVVLPGAVAAGTIAGSLAWWKAVLFTWTCGILFKGGSTTSTSK